MPNSKISDSAPYEIENCLGILRVFSDGSISRSDAPLADTPLSDDGSVIWDDVIYDSQHNLHLRHYTPKSTPTKLPVVFYIHGGGFCIGSRTWPNFHNFCIRLSAQLPAVVIAPDYRLAPENKIPDSINDCFNALRWTRDQLEDESADLNKVFVVGDSAGGTIAHNLALRLGGDGGAREEPSIRGYIFLDPFFGGTERTKSEVNCSKDTFLSLDLTDRYTMSDLSGSISSFQSESESDKECKEIAPPSSQRQLALKKARSEKKPVGTAESVLKPIETKKKRRKRVPNADIYSHFVSKNHPLRDVIDGVDKLVGSFQRLHCKYCDTSFVKSPTTHGTSTLRKHIETICKLYPGRANVSSGQQMFSSGVVDGQNTTMMVNWTQDNCITAATHMIVVDELPFSYIEAPGFSYFCSQAVPLFKVPCRQTIVKRFLTMYDSKKEELRNELKSRSVCLTTDTWTSCQNINYMVVTAHFIDRGWNMHKRVLAFCVIPNHEGVTIGQILESCLLDWSIDNVLCISVDNASANKIAIDYVRDKLCSWETKPILGGRLMHVRCLAHIINIIVRSGLKTLEKSVVAIRNAVRYVRGSSARNDEFRKCVEKEKIDCRKVCVLDVPTRWNSTFLMLDGALGYRKAFDRLYYDDMRFRRYFDEEEHDDEDELLISSESVVPTSRRVKRVGPPTVEDWDNAAVFVKFLKVFYEATVHISASLKPTSHKAFQDIVTVETELEDLCSVGLGPDSSEADKVLYEMATKMKVKYNKYFGKLDNMNSIFLVAVVLDPRYKLKYFERVCKAQLNLSTSEIKKKSDEVRQLLVELCDLYGAKSESGGSRGKKKSVSDNVETITKPISGRRAAMEEDWDREIEQNEEVVVGHEVDRYLLDPIEKVVKKPGVEVDWLILDWWKVNGDKYPNLQSLARDVLAVQVSTVASESTFSTGKRVIDPYRSSLLPKTVEKLICLQNWLKSDAIMGLQYVPEPGEMETYEFLEEEHMKGVLNNNDNIVGDSASNPSLASVKTKSSDASVSARAIVSKESKTRNKRQKKN